VTFSTPQRHCILGDHGIDLSPLFIVIIVIVDTTEQGEDDIQHGSAELD
jgi:hypothetical protein